MRSDPRAYELVAPKRLEDALAIIDREPGVWRLLAGGTDVMVSYASGKLPHAKWLSVWGLPELGGIHVEEQSITFGALTTYTDVQSHEVVRAELPMLVQAASETGGVAIQNRGTLGGNIVNASPAADSPPALMAYGAELELTSAKGARWVPYDRFHTGYKQTILAPNEIVSRVRVPRTRGTSDLHFYRKVGPRKAQAISKVCFAGFASKGVVRIALGGVAPVVKRCPAAESAVRDLARAKEAIAKEISPIDDVRSNARYRGKVAENLLVDFVLQMERHVGLAG